MRATLVDLHARYPAVNRRTGGKINFHTPRRRLASSRFNVQAAYSTDSTPMDDTQAAPMLL